MITCEICNQILIGGDIRLAFPYIFGEDNLIWDEDLQVYFCRVHYDDIMNIFNSYD